MAAFPFLFLAGRKPEKVIRRFSEYTAVEVKFDKPLSRKMFHEICEELPELRIELDKHGKLIIMPPVDINGGLYEDEVHRQLSNWRFESEYGFSFSPSTGFDLPDGSVRSSDGAWANSDKVNALSPEERKKFASLVPDFVIEIRSSSDRLSKLKSKMKDTWIKNGVRLAWLIDPIARKAYIYRADGSEEVIPNFNHVLSGEDVCPGFQLDLKTLNF